MLPLCGPALAATAIFTFMYAWEDFFWPLIVISSEDHTRRHSASHSSW